MPAGYPPKRAQKIIGRAMECSRFRVAKAVFEPGEDDGVPWSSYLRGMAMEFRRVARAFDRAADACDA